MPAQISVQLYTLREQMKAGNHAAVIKRLGEIGYAGIECAGFYGLKPTEIRKLAQDHGMVISSNHCEMPTAANLQQIIDTHRDLGTSYAVSGFWIPDFDSVDAIRHTADKINAVVEPLEQAGITLLLHNHWFEFARIDGKIAYQHLVEYAPKVKFEVDTYWACNFGAEVPAKMVAMFRDRTHLLHLKDGDFVRDQPMVACGKGKQDFPAIVAAADPRLVKWAIVELDACATDMVQAVEDSYHYLVGKQLAVGRKPARSAAR